MDNTTMSQCYKLNNPSVICEAIEGDLVLVHFDSGFYYSVRGLGAAIGQRLFAGMAPQALAQEIANHYQHPLAEVQKDLVEFVASLIREQLVVPGAATEAAPAPPLSRESLPICPCGRVRGTSTLRRTNSSRPPRASH